MRSILSDMESPLAWLESHGAQRDVLDGVRPFASDWETLWLSCPRGDWLLGIAVRLGVDHVLLVRAAIASARTALEYTDDDGAASVLDVASRWTTGDASEAQVKDAASRLEAASARASSPAAEAAARAAVAAATSTLDREAVPLAAAFAAEATIVATMDCGLAMAMAWAHRTCADAVRATIDWQLVARIVDDR